MVLSGRWLDLCAASGTNDLYAHAFTDIPDFNLAASRVSTQKARKGKWGGIVPDCTISE
jgi:hypothetical protein